MNRKICREETHGSSGVMYIDTASGVAYAGAGSLKYLFDFPEVGICTSPWLRGLSQCGGYWDRPITPSSRLWRRFWIRLSADFYTEPPGTKIVKVRWEDILYVEGLKDYVMSHTKQQKVGTLQRLKSLEDQLPPDKFIRIHNSFIVSVDAIEIIHKGEVHIGTALIPISDTYRKSFKDFIDRNQIQ